MKKISSLSILLILINIALSQTSWTNSVHVNAGGGIHSLLYRPADWPHSTEFGFMLEAQYQRAIIDDFSLGVGISFMSLSGKSTYNYTFTQTDVMLPGANYPSSVTTSIIEWVEMQNFFQLFIPIEAYYKWNVKGYGFIAGAGLSVSFPFRSRYKTESGSFTRTAHMDTVGVSFADLPNHGLGTFDSTFSGNLKGKINVGLVFDLGANVYTTEKYKIYAGLYGSVALAPIFRSEHNAIFDESLTYRGVITSILVDKVNYSTFGVKVGIALGADKKQAKKKPTVKPTPEEPKNDNNDNYDEKDRKTIDEARNKAINRAKNASKEESSDINYDDPKVKKALEETEKRAKERVKQLNN